MSHKSEEETIDVAHERWWQTFEVIFGIPFLAGIILQLIIPFSLPRGFLTPAVIFAAVVLIVIGIVLIFFARQELARYSQPTDPGHPTSKLVTTGVFSFSRNPLYLGGVFILTGITLLLNLFWALVLLLAALVAGHYILIVPEERYLYAKFGTEYQTYADSVHRWIGRACHMKSE